ncbi:MAG: LysR substrate-binding domain-containing protein [Rhodanobacter sp.]
MTLVQLRYFIAIVDAGLNITLAASQVHATQPGLSKQLGQLEDELGLQLFIRKGKSLDAVTAAGQQVLLHARSMLSDAANIHAIASNLRKETHGKLRIATTHTQARFALPAALAALNNSYPHISVHLQPVRDSEILAQLEAGKVDVAVISSAGATPTVGVALPAYRWQRVIISPQNHPLALSAKAPTLQALAALPLISYDSSLKPESSLRQAFETAGLTPRVVMTAGDADLIKTYVRAGLGIGILAEMALSPADTDLRVMPAHQLFPDCTTWIVLRRESVLRDYILEFIYQFAPHLGRKDVVRALTSEAAPVWSGIPDWSTRTRGSIAAPRRGTKKSV